MEDDELYKRLLRAKYGRPMTTYYVTYHEILQMDPGILMIPGQRVTMRESTLAALWIHQHQGTLMKMVFALEGMDHLDFALAAWRDFPDLVENGDPGHG